MLVVKALWLRAVFAFLALPVLVAFVVPFLLLGGRLESRSFNLLALIPFALGVVLLLWCVGAFYRTGHGTLAPWDPPRALVVTGVYRLSRNPMYVAVLLILYGWALGFWSRPLAIYAVVVMIAFHLRVVFGEEPWLARTHGGAWEDYKGHVPRWLGVRRDRR
jgi:protein-S-isoprenylcysteine O-methyltransferase Ste14